MKRLAAVLSVIAWGGLVAIWIGLMWASCFIPTPLNLVGWGVWSALFGGALKAAVEDRMEREG